MIKANELKVGNWVNITGQSIKLTGPKLSFIFDEDGLITRCEPIPLTPEILEKCGFEKIKEYTPDQISYRLTDKFQHFDILLNKDTKGIVIVCFSCGNRTVILYHLHQLQNLYFALIGKELPVENLMTENKNTVNIDT